MALLSNLHKTYVPLSEILGQREISELIQMVITRMPRHKGLPDDIQRNKLEFIQETVNSSLFQAHGWYHKDFILDVHSKVS